MKYDCDSTVKKRRWRGRRENGGRASRARDTLITAVIELFGKGDERPNARDLTFEPVALCILLEHWPLFAACVDVTDAEMSRKLRLLPSPFEL